MIDKIWQFFHGFFSRSHRGSHLIGGFLVGLVCGVLGGVAVAAALEFKDCQHDRVNGNKGLEFKRWNWRCWDWVDWWCTAGAGIAGGIVQVVVLGVVFGWFD
jgi:hypothetical protein